MDTNSSLSVNGTANISLDKNKSKSDDKEELILKYIEIVKILFYLMGISGNVFCIIIWTKKRFLLMARSTTCLTLAAANLAYLTTHACNVLVEAVDGADIVARSNLSCKFMFGLFAFCQHLDSWCIVTLTIERLFAIALPYKSKTYLTRRNLSISTAIIILLFLGFNCYLGVDIIMLVTLPNGKKICIPKKGWAGDLRSLLIGQLPLLLIIPANAIIVGKVLYQKRKMKLINEKAKGDEKRALHITIMILSVTLTYIALILPFSAFMFCCSSDKNKLMILSILPTTNASINFYMYFLSSKIFRAEVRQQMSKVLMRLGCKRIANNIVVPMDGSTFGPGSSRQT